MPNLRNCFRDAHIVCLERVQRNSNGDSCGPQQPCEEDSDSWNTPRRKVINNTGLESNVGVDEQKGAQGRVHGGIQRASCKRGNAEGDETSGDKPLKRPVIAAMCRRGVGYGCGIIEGSFNLLRQRRKNWSTTSGVESSNP